MNLFALEKIVNSPSASTATDWEKGSLMNFLAEERLYEWMAFMLTDKSFPLTLNAIAFVLDLSRRMNIDSPKDAKIITVISALFTKADISRKKVAQILSEVLIILLMKLCILS